MNEAVEKIITWRHNLKRNVGIDVLNSMKQLEIYETYLEILSEIDYGIMMDKEYAFYWDGVFYADIQQYPKDELNILCYMNLLKESEKVPGYHELVFDKSKFKVLSIQ